MIDILKKMFGVGAKPDLNEVMGRGAIIFDVRTPAEYKGGHVKGSRNIPLGDLQKQLNKLDKNKPIITCCASGMRSAGTKSTLLSAGFTEVHNGGSWTALRYLEK
jgi:rhodanese-related sulfurtransferase